MLLISVTEHVWKDPTVKHSKPLSSSDWVTSGQRLEWVAPQHELCTVPLSPTCCVALTKSHLPMSFPDLGSMTLWPRLCEKACWPLKNSIPDRKLLRSPDSWALIKRPRSTTSAPPGNLLEMQIPRPYLRCGDSDTLGTENQRVSRTWKEYVQCCAAVNNDSLINLHNNDQDVVPTSPKSISLNDLFTLNESGLEEHKIIQIARTTSESRKQ